MTERRQRWGLQFLLFTLGLVVWRCTVHRGVVDWDTDWLVVNNPILSSGSTEAVWDILFGLDVGTRLTLGAEYLPVRDLTVLMDHAIFGTEWAGHHLVNLAWYLLSCGLVLALLRLIVGPGPGSWVGAALFCVHPLHVESVAWLASRKDVVSLALVLVTAWGWIGADREEGPVWVRSPIVLALAALLAHWSKNTAVVLPAILLMLTFCLRRPQLRKPGWWGRWMTVASTIGFGLWLSMRVGAQVHMFAEGRADSVFEVLRIQLAVICQYMQMLVWPTGLSAVYAEPNPESWLALPVLGGAGIILGSGLIAWKARRCCPGATAGIAWFWICLLPVSQIVPIQNLVADRYLLLPSVGLCMGVAALVPQERRHRETLCVGLLLTAMLAVTTQRRAQVWRSGVALWSDATEKQPNVVVAWSRLAGAVESRGGDVGTVLDLGFTAHANHPMLWQSRGIHLDATGDAQGAEAAFRRALVGDPELRRAANNLAVLLHRREAYTEAENVARALVDRFPVYVKGWNTLGAIHLAQRDGDAALEAMNRAVQLAPHNAKVWVNRGSAAQQSGDVELARACWEQALRLDPDNRWARAGLRAFPHQ